MSISDTVSSSVPSNVAQTPVPIKGLVDQLSSWAFFVPVMAAVLAAIINPIITGYWGRWNAKEKFEYDMKVAKANNDTNTALANYRVQMDREALTQKYNLDKVLEADKHKNQSKLLREKIILEKLHAFSDEIVKISGIGSAIISRTRSDHELSREILEFARQTKNLRLFVDDTTCKHLDKLVDILWNFNTDVEFIDEIGMSKFTDLRKKFESDISETYSDISKSISRYLSIWN